MSASRRMLAIAALALAIAPSTAGASLKISAWTSHEHLSVARDGSAQITWREAGRTRVAVIRGDHVSYRGRIGARHIGPHVAPDVAYGVDEVVTRRRHALRAPARAPPRPVRHGWERPSCASRAGAARSRSSR